MILKPVLLKTEGPMAQTNKIGVDFMISILIFVENWLLYRDIHDFSVRLRTGSNPADINRFRSHTGK